MGRTSLLKSTVPVAAAAGDKRAVGASPRTPQSRTKLALENFIARRVTRDDSDAGDTIKIMATFENSRKYFVLGNQPLNPGFDNRICKGKRRAVSVP